MHSYDYAIVRVLPRVERGEQLNAGVILSCAAIGYLRASFELDEAVLRCVAPGLDLEPVRAALVTSLGFGHVSAVVALAHPDVFVEAIPAEHRAAYVERAHGRRVSGARARLGAAYGGDALFDRRTDRRLGPGSAAELREREAGMLLDPAGTLSGLAGT